jgi:hypothetical protein
MRIEMGHRRHTRQKGGDAKREFAKKMTSQAKRRIAMPVLRPIPDTMGGVKKFTRRPSA